MPDTNFVTCAFRKMCLGIIFTHTQLEFSLSKFQETFWKFYIIRCIPITFIQRIYLDKKKLYTWSLKNLNSTVSPHVNTFESKDNYENTLFTKFWKKAKIWTIKPKKVQPYSRECLFRRVNVRLLQIPQNCSWYR